MTVETIIGRCGLLLLAATMIYTPEAAAQSCGTADYEFQLSFGYWDNPLAWQPQAVPGVGDTVCVPDGREVAVHENADEACDWFFVESGGAITISKDSTLTVDADSVLNGLMTIAPYPGSYASLIISDDVTISGTGGGEVHLLGGVIHTSGGEDNTLTLDGGCDTEEETCSITLHGTGAVSCDIVNHAIVLANKQNAEVPVFITMDGSDISGDGFWVAQNGGALAFDGTLSGAGTLRLGNTGVAQDSLGRIEINGGTDCFAGKVDLANGTFEASTSFGTSGNLYWHSEDHSGGPTMPIIHVAAGETAVFGGVLTGCP